MHEQGVFMISLDLSSQLSFIVDVSLPGGNGTNITFQATATVAELAKQLLSCEPKLKEKACTVTQTVHEVRKFREQSLAPDEIDSWKRDPIMQPQPDPQGVVISYYRHQPISMAETNKKILDVVKNETGTVILNVRFVPAKPRKPREID